MREPIAALPKNLRLEFRLIYSPGRVMPENSPLVFKHVGTGLKSFRRMHTLSGYFYGVMIQCIITSTRCLVG